MHRENVILHYLKDRMTGFPFDPTVDLDFVDVLLDDFGIIDDVPQLVAHCCRELLCGSHARERHRGRGDRNVSRGVEDDEEGRIGNTSG